MAGKRILTSRITENMVTADHVYTAEEQLLIPAGTVLTSDIIEALKEHSVFAIRVEVEQDGKTPVLGDKTQQEGKEEVKYASPEPAYQAANEADTKNYYDAVRESKEYQEFHAGFVETVDHVKDALNRVVMQNEEIDSKEILSEVKSVVGASRNSLNILDMLQCMKGYDDVTYVHSMNVALLSNVIATAAMPDISKEDLDTLTLAGLLHDIGKMMISDEVLMKKDRLTISEFNIIKTHVLHGNNILKNLDLDPRVAEVAMRHHERCDGSGYPGGYHSEQISPFAKIVAIADTYDAMTSDRVYRKAICPFEVLHMFESEGLTKYEVEYLLPFLSTAVQAYMNTEVRLTTGETGKVVLVNTEEFSRPIVKVGETYHDLRKERSIYIDRIMD